MTTFYMCWDKKKKIYNLFIMFFLSFHSFIFFPGAARAHMGVWEGVFIIICLWILKISYFKNEIWKKSMTKPNSMLHNQFSSRGMHSCTYLNLASMYIYVCYTRKTSGLYREVQQHHSIHLKKKTTHPYHSLACKRLDPL